MEKRRKEKNMKISMTDERKA